MSCTGNCDSCSTSCTPEQKKENMYEPANQYSSIKKVIGVVSGKGGVGKSLTTSYLSVLMNRKGYNTAILDADITGPSIPKTFGVHSKAIGNEMGMFPAVTEKGTKLMSINLLLDEEEMPVVWRGPIIAGTVKQFWTDVVWDKVDYMFVDMPPGTGDVPLTVFQSIPLDGIIIVTSPQELVAMIVGKAVNMAKAMNIPILGIVENYSYIACPDCGKQISVFGESHVEAVANKYGLKVLDRIPIDPLIAAAIDKGQVESLKVSYLDNTADYIESTLNVEKTSVKSSSRRIIVPIEDNVIDYHFGKAKKFCLYELENQKLKSRTLLECAGTGHESAIALLIENHVDTLLCANVGADALQELLNAKILVYPGLSGDADVAVATYLEGVMAEAKTL